jgi:hypothetical protein
MAAIAAERVVRHLEARRLCRDEEAARDWRRGSWAKALI